jgi:phosphoenolpyruvate carboxykinase (ATP)
VLDPRSTWPNAADYDAQASKLAQMFVKNFERFADRVSPAVKAAGPRG